MFISKALVLEIVISFSYEELNATYLRVASSKKCQHHPELTGAASWFQSVWKVYLVPTILVDKMISLWAGGFGWASECEYTLWADVRYVYPRIVELVSMLLMMMMLMLMMMIDCVQFQFNDCPKACFATQSTLLLSERDKHIQIVGQLSKFRNSILLFFSWCELEI